MKHRKTWVSEINLQTSVVLESIDQPFYFMKCAVVLLMSTPNQDPLFSEHKKIANTSQYFFSSDSEGRLLSKQLKIPHMP